MNRAEAMMAVSLLAHHEAEAASAKGDTDEAVRLVGVSDDAYDAAGDESAYERMMTWLTGRSPDTSGAVLPPPVPQTYSDLGI